MGYGILREDKSHIPSSSALSVPPGPDLAWGQHPGMGGAYVGSRSPTKS